MDKPFDLIVIGAGPSAWTAATFLVRAGVSTLVVGQDEQSGLAYATDVKNYPGFPEGVSGRALLDKFIEQAQTQGVKFIHEEVVHAEKQKEVFLVRTARRKEFIAKNLILAHGANYIKADVPGEKQYTGTGVHYCALCDGPIYKNKDVVVLGNGNLAAEEATELSVYAKSVKIVSHSPQVNFSPEYTSFLKEKNVEIIIRRVKKISGTETHAHSITLDDASTLSFDALFISLGIASSHMFSQKLGLELTGDFIKTDEHMRTNILGVWAVGMARGGVNQIVKSVGDGGVAAIDAIKKIKGLPSFIDHT